MSYNLETEKRSEYFILSNKRNVIKKNIVRLCRRGPVNLYNKVNYYIIIINLNLKRFFGTKMPSKTYV